MSSVIETEVRAEPTTPRDDKFVTVVFNPVSGTGDPEQRKEAISEALARHGYTCQFLVTTPDVEVKSIVDNAVKEGAELITVSGGDGTVMEVLSALVGTDIPAAIVPSGTGNLLSVNLGVPGTVPESIDVALSGKPYALDLARARMTALGADGPPDGDWRYFAVMGGIGLDAQMIADADRRMKRRLGVLAYLWAIVKNLPNRPSIATVTVDDGPPIRRRAKAVIVANMGKVIGGLEAMPTAIPDDGRLDVGFIMPETFGQWLRLLWMALLGRPQDAPELDVFQGNKIRIRPAFPEQVELDGESYGRTSALDVEVVPQAVRIMLPVDAPAAKDASGAPAKTARPLWPAIIGLAATVAIGVGLIAWKRKK